MATRQQTSGVVPNLPGPVYEDLRPTSEWKHEEQSNLLLVHLPGFVKEQLKVSLEGMHTLKIRGERVVGVNTWSRFQEEFRIPEDCDMTGIRGRFELGTLTITMPKKSGPEEAAKTTHEAPRSQDTADKPRHDKVQEDTNPKANPASDATRKVDDKSVVQPPIQQETASATKHGKGQDNDKMTSTTSEGKHKDEKGLEKPKMPEIASGKTTEKEKEGSGKGKESIETVKKEKEEESEGTAWDGGGKLEKYKKAMHGLVSLKEERDLVVNMGAAILVMVALGAYISYTWAYSGKADH
ncbi:inactive protein RESTRICTED TEV MOVEMENT 2-like [Actinidia eriantha]|uniref:inactive protein RESTRICTED TEV MOVEMENT 2-like n=1 Tax=Actinidia eriantha TaxID=165200 RepID=UPI0025855450|nr:inactive protein RESTRICTED TEV MOVEMENT 2-like [Actinidia eriantha]